MKLINILLFCCLTFTLFAQNSRPNIIYILADDMGIGDISGLSPDSKIQTLMLARGCPSCLLLFRLRRG